ncbi:GAF domain-containing protein, partial [Candidatus Poribacteria bacterium]
MRYSALASIEKRVDPVVKYILLLAVSISAWLVRPDMLRHFVFYIYAGILICGTLIYIYSRRRLLSTYHVAVMTLGSCLDVFSISFIYCILAGNHLVPIVFLFLPLPIMRLIMFYPSAKESLLAAGLSSAVFLLTIAALVPRQLTLLSFWGYFASMWPIFGVGIAIAGKLLGQLNRSTRDHQLTIQAFQMVSSLVEMSESTARLREKNKILQKSVEIISEVMDIQSCAAWSYENGLLCPVASDGLDKDQEDGFHKMEFSISDIPAFTRALGQKVPFMVFEGDLKTMAPSFYLQCFDAGAMLVIPLMNNEYVLGCIALHWLAAPENIASQELAILSGIATQIGITLENVRLMEELREKEEIRGRLLERVISVQEEERERIA